MAADTVLEHDRRNVFGKRWRGGRPGRRRLVCGERRRPDRDCDERDTNCDGLAHAANSSSSRFRVLCSQFVFMFGGFRSDGPEGSEDHHDARHTDQ